MAARMERLSEQQRLTARLCPSKSSVMTSTVGCMAPSTLACVGRQLSCREDDWVVTMDADDTHPPRLIRDMVAAGQGAEIVIASRFQPGAVWHGRTWDRILFSYGVSWLFRAMWPMPSVRDYTCGYRAYRAGLLQRAWKHWGDALVSEPSFACMPDLLWKLSRLQPAIREVPLELHYDRKPGPSKMQVARTIRRTLVLLFKRRLGL